VLDHSDMITTAIENEIVLVETKMKEEKQMKRNMNLMTPMTKQEYDTQQSIVREVFDPLSGRMRLVKGSGEIIEQIRTKEQHQQLNQVATASDGYAYAKAIQESVARHKWVRK